MCDPAESSGNNPRPFLPHSRFQQCCTPGGSPDASLLSSSQQPLKFLETSGSSNPLTFPQSLLSGTSLEHQVVVILSLLVLLLTFPPPSLNRSPSDPPLLPLLHVIQHPSGELLLSSFLSFNLPSAPRTSAFISLQVTPTDFVGPFLS